MRPKTRSTLSSGVSSPRLSDAFGPTISKIERTTVNISCLVITLLWSEIYFICADLYAYVRPNYSGLTKIIKSKSPIKSFFETSTRGDRERKHEFFKLDGTRIIIIEDIENVPDQIITKNYDESTVWQYYLTMQIVLGFHLGRTVYKCHKMLWAGTTGLNLNRSLVDLSGLKVVQESLTWGVNTPPGQSRIKPCRHAFISFAFSGWIWPSHMIEVILYESYLF